MLFYQLLCEWTDSEAINLEAVLELAPDLHLVKNGIGEQVYAELSKTPPTIALGIPPRDADVKQDRSKSGTGVRERYKGSFISIKKTGQRNQLLTDYIVNDFVPHLDLLFCAESEATGANLRVMWLLVAQ
ncbi:hypothetical protein ACX93W_17260 [Paenibacillus sp. CAU 1782]